MSERNEYPPGVSCWVDTLQPDPEAAVRFYGDLFGWTFAGPGSMPGDPPGKYSRRPSTFRDSGRRSWPTRPAPCSP